MVNRFEEVGLVDDAAFARDWVASPARRLKGRRVLASELGDKGVPQDAIQAALSEVTSQRELDAAREVARRRAAGLRGVDRATRRRRVAGALARRGFDPTTISTVLREVLDADPGEAMDAEEAGD